ncbi:MAG: glycosyltransferase [Epsilonproteobacteria bacterium]|nr:hypothetical protein [Campylobacterota bacterium]NPA57428.1 glycosyltransferase [Campylobacterota bacterium]
MKVLQFIASQGYMGAERSVVELANELSKEVEVIAPVVRGCTFRERFSPRVRVIPLRSHPTRSNPFLLWELAQLIRREKVDIVHSHGAKGTQLLYPLWKIMGFPFVATKRNSRQSRIFRKVPHLVGVSREAVAGIEGAQVIYNGIEPLPSPPQELEPIFTMVAIGALRKVKGFDLLIRAVAPLPFDYRLWIVGEGEERQELERLIGELQLGERVYLLGMRDDTASLQRRAHLQIISSHREGFSRVLIEGLFYSNLILSTPVGGSNEILPPSLLCSHRELSEKITDLYRNYRSYREQFEKVREIRHRFTLQRVAREYRDLYRKIMEG